MVFNGTENSDSIDFEWDIPSGFIKHGSLENPLGMEVLIFGKSVISDFYAPFSSAPYWLPDGILIFGTSMYPLVNVDITMENHYAINGKTHYFYGHGQYLC